MVVLGNELPDPLLNADGRKVESAADWREWRREQIVELFRTQVFGREPAGRPESLSFQMTDTCDAMEGAAVRKQVEIRFEGPRGAGMFKLLLFIPAGSSKPVPAFLLINNRGPKVADAHRVEQSSFWPAEFIVSRGYAAAVFQVEELDPDYEDGFVNGIHGLFDPSYEQRPADAWGTIAAWAWGASRALDYMESDPHIDSGRVALVGHSRGGKTALWAGAIDERFAMIVSNNSGCTGAALSRGKIGETVRDINNRFPHWFCGNYKTYNGRESELPLDQHMLLALLAPRPLYVTSASEDTWADPESEFRSLVHAEPVYRLYGLQGLETNSFPPADSPVRGERYAYHVRTGKHNMELYDWRQFIDFADTVL